MNRLLVGVALSLAVAACGDKKSEETAPPQAPPQHGQPQQPQSPPASPPPAQPEPAKPDRATPPPSDAPKSRAPQTPPPQARPVTPEEPKPTAKPEEPKTPPKEEPKPVTKEEPTLPVEAPPQKPAPSAVKSTMTKPVLVLTGAALGGVKLDHKQHAEQAGNTCTPCHHASKPEKPASAPQQACSACHTKVAMPPMKTKYQNAFHDAKAQSGTCIDCHKTENTNGKKAPLKCSECHRKENK